MATCTPRILVVKNRKKVKNMGCSWYTYAGTLYQVKKGWLLIPKYAQKWAGTDKLEIAMGGEYDDFKMATTPLKEKSHTFLNGDVLIGIFEKLYNNQKVDVTLKDCYYEEFEVPYDFKQLEDLRHHGINTSAPWTFTPYSLKITKNESETYESCKYYSPSGQMWYPEEDDPDFEEFFDQQEYNQEWKQYFGDIES
jgi:hypothetical protein